MASKTDHRSVGRRPIIRCLRQRATFGSCPAAQTHMVELDVVLAETILDVLEFCVYIILLQGELFQGDKGPDDFYAHFYCIFAAENAGEHGDALGGLELVTNCDQFGLEAGSEMICMPLCLLAFY